MSRKKTTWARIQMLLIASVFFGPLAVATFMYYGGHLQPEGRTNHGALLQPTTSIAELLPNSVIATEGDGYWLLVYANHGSCGDACATALYNIRQIRLTLGREMERLRRIFLHGETAPDTVFLSNEHAGLITNKDEALTQLLNNKVPADLSTGGCFLVDPLGNLVMYFPPSANPDTIVKDVKHLLKLSRIG